MSTDEKLPEVVVHHHVHHVAAPFTESYLGYGCRRVMGWCVLAFAAWCGWRSYDCWGSDGYLHIWWIVGAVVALLVGLNLLRPRE